MKPLLEDVEFLAHFGVKGMRWGVRRDRSSGVPRKTDREARKDAEEHARAKMYYGKGAGTRRKLINKTVDAKKARDPAYAKAFDDHLSRQKLDVHASKARSERKRTDRKDTIKKSAGQLARSRTGEMGTKAAFTAIAVGGATYLNSPQGRRMMRQSKVKVKVWAKSGAPAKVAKTAKQLIEYIQAQR